MAAASSGSRSCQLCPNPVEGEALLCGECQLPDVEISKQARRFALWGHEQ